ncbi:MAG TPA: ABC transporter permease [bacterium]|nr:ABC transporter permease [bacterium]
MVDLLTSYAKISLRNVRKYKLYSFINIAGLATGFAVFILILLYVQRERSYDNYHRDGERIYRVTVDFQSGSELNSYAFNIPPLAPALVQNFPQVENAGRILNLGNSVQVRYGNNNFYESQLLYTDPEIFAILTIPFLAGNPETALNNPHSVVISQTLAKKYFGSVNPLGLVLNMDDRDYTVTGVVQDCPHNTHLQYNMFTSIERFANMAWMDDWTWPGAYTYIKVQPGSDITALEQQINLLAAEHAKNDSRAAGIKFTFNLQQVADIHLHSHRLYESSYPGDPGMLLLFTGVGLLILIIAASNFINLSIARNTVRAKEAVIRKVVGANSLQLVSQFLGDSLLVTGAALLLAFILVMLALPFYNRIIDGHFSISCLAQQNIIIPVVFITLLLGIIAGGIPALALAGFKPVMVLRGQIKTGPQGMLVRRVLVTGQFFITVILVISALVVYRQLGFMQNSYPGFSGKQKLIIPVRGIRPLEQNYTTVKNELRTLPGVAGVSVSSGEPGQGAGSTAVWPTGANRDNKQMLYVLFYDEDFIPNYGIELAAGRNFNAGNMADVERSCLINEAAVIALGFASPQQAIGEKIHESIVNSEVEIVGVTRNFNYRSMHQKVEPLLILMTPGFYSTITMNLNSTNNRDILALTEKKWAELFPGKPFSYYFLDESLRSLYAAEEQMARMVTAFAIFALWVACLGLYGLIAIITGMRSKEIGMRKILGCTTARIVGLLTADIIKWVLVANVLAWPLAWYFVQQWLQDYPNRATIGAPVYILAGVIVTVIALVTVSSRILKAAAENPVETLRCE